VLAAASRAYAAFVIVVAAKSIVRCGWIPLGVVWRMSWGSL